MDQAAESVAATEPIEWTNLARGSPVGCWGLGERRPLAERAVRAMLVVVERVSSHDVLEVPAADDQQPVEAFAAQTPDPALGVRSRPRRPHGRLDHPDAFGAEDLVEVTGELAVSITDEEPRADICVVERPQ